MAASAQSTAERTAVTDSARLNVTHGVNATGTISDEV